MPFSRSPMKHSGICLPMFDLGPKIRDAEILVAQKKGTLDVISKQCESLAAKIDTAGLSARNHAGALDVLRSYASLQEENVRLKVERLVTDGLCAVFEREDLAFRFKFELGRSGQMTATPVLSTAIGDKTVETTATDARGGGVLDAAAFLLRTVMLCLMRPRLDRVMFCDEIFKHLSRDHLGNAAALLRRLSEKLGVQIVMVTHKDEFVDTADRVFDVSIRDGVTKIKVRSED